MRLQDKAQDWFERSVRFLTRTRLRRALFLLSFPALLLYLAFRQPDYQPPIFDAQVHYNEASWQRVSVDAVLNTAEEVNVPWLLVASMPNDGTWQLYHRAPQRIIPMLVPGLSREDQASWFNDEKIAAYIERELKDKPYRGIGEFFLFDGQVNTPVVRKMVELALARNLVLHARSDPQALRQLFDLGPALRIIWAHAGVFTQPDTIQEMLERYPALWVEISLRGDVAPKGRLAVEWRALMLRYPDRFLLGSGTYNNEYWYQFRYNLNRYRGWLKDLPPDVAQRIAYRNGMRLFDLQFEAGRN